MSVIIVIIIIIINVTYMAQIRIKCSKLKCAMSTVTGVVAYVIKNVFSRVRKTDSDMSSPRAAGRLFHTVGPLTVKLRSP